MRSLVLGAGGTTGRTVSSRLAALGHEVVLGVRDPSRLERVGPVVPGAEVRRVDVTDRAQLAGALIGIDGVVLCAGPFETLGALVLEAVLEGGLAYADVSGEPLWARRIYEDLEQPARRSGARLVPTAAASPGLGDVLATALVGQGSAQRISVGYKMTRYRPSVGSIRSAMKIYASGALVWDGGALVTVPAGTRQRRIGNYTGVLFPLPDPMTLARHLDVKESDIFILVKRFPSAFGRTFTLSRPIVVHPMVQRLVAAAPIIERRREGSGRMDAYVVVEDDAGTRLGTAKARDVYEITAEFAARALHAANDAQPGVYTPAQLLHFDDFDPETVTFSLDSPSA